MHQYYHLNACRSILMMGYLNVKHTPKYYTLQWKGKVHTTTGHKGPEGELRYSSTLSLTLSLDGIGWSMLCPGRFTPGKEPVPIVQEAGWAPGLVWTGVENLAPHRDLISGQSSPQRVAIPTALSQPTYSSVIADKINYSLTDHRL